VARIFCSYSHADERMRQQLGSHLSVLIREGAITFWSDRIIRPGEEIDEAISENLERADIILLLVSADFLASNYCYDVEVRRAMELHELGKAHVVPVILRDCDWHHAPFGKLMAVPTDGRPVKSWPDRDKAYRIIVDRLRPLIEQVRAKDTGGVEAAAINAGPDVEVSATPVLDIARLGRTTRRSTRSEGGSAIPKRFLPQLARLIDIADDLHRRSSDTLDANAGRTINYIFDTNVFQLFVNPRLFPKTVSLFHSHPWASHKEAASWENIDEQSALLTGEYLFSGSLPGQHEASLYLTSWHRRELLLQVEHMVREVQQAANDIDVVREFLYRMAQFRADVALGRHQSDSARSRDGHVSADIEILREAGVPEAQLQTYLSTRMALEALIAGESIASLCQLQRMMSRELFGSVRKAEQLADLDDEDNRAVADEAAHWVERLTHELKVRTGTEPRLHHRLHSSILADAQSLALVHRLSNRRKSDSERTVLVTGDALLFSAYRRWHSELPEDEPFLLRRVAQYAPIFALGDRDVVESPQPAVIDEFVEMGLFPFNIIKSRLIPSTESRLRRIFSQQIADGQWEPGGDLHSLTQHMFHDLKSEWYKDFIEEIPQFGSVWRRIETITLGLNPDLLTYRLASAIPEAFAFRPAQAALSAREVGDWIQATMASLHKSAISLWLPIALDGMERFRRGKAANPTILPLDGLTFRFHFSADGPPIVVGRHVGDEGFSLGALPLDPSGDEHFLSSHPIIAFGVAAFLAAECTQFTQAVRYADLCVDVAKLEGGEGIFRTNVTEAERLALSIKDLARGKAKGDT
jgi:hypothetical protein